jgi:hypothetical protein
MSVWCYEVPLGMQQFIHVPSDLELLHNMAHATYGLFFLNRIQNFLLHPKHNSQVDGKQVYDKDGSCTIKGRKLVKQIEIEGMRKQ